MQRPKEEELKAKIRAEQQRRMKESHWVLREESTRFVAATAAFNPRHPTLCVFSLFLTRV